MHKIAMKINPILILFLVDECMIFPLNSCFTRAKLKFSLRANFIIST